MAKIENAKFTLILRGQSEGIDKYYFQMENKLYTLFVIIGIVCIFITEDDFSSLCLAMRDEFDFLGYRIDALNAASPFLGCKFAVQNVANIAIDILLIFYYAAVFLVYIREDESDFFNTKTLVTMLLHTLFLFFVVYFIYFMDISVLDPRFPGGMGVMNSHFILLLAAGTNMLVVLVLANYVAFLVKLCMRTKGKWHS